ncbi:MAG TPA: TolC family protein [Burkholderiaceae bacterium]|nr:TolC family protein [Burkholderiaceae bacterium]
MSARKGPRPRFAVMVLACGLAAAAGPAAARPAKPGATKPASQAKNPNPAAGSRSPASARSTAGMAARAAALQARQTRQARGQVLRHAIIERPTATRPPVRRIGSKQEAPPLHDTMASVGDRAQDADSTPREDLAPRDAAGNRASQRLSAPAPSIASLTPSPRRQPANASPPPADSEQLAAQWIPETTVLPQLGARPLDLTVRADHHVEPVVLAADGRTAAAAEGAPMTAGYTQMQTLLRMAAERSAAIRDAQAAVRASELDIKEASGARLPQVSMDLTSRYTSGAGDNQTSSQRGAPFYSVTGTMPLYDFGRISNIVDSRSASRRAADARLDSALESLALETAAAALELGRYRLALTTAEGYLRNVSRLASMLVDITREDPGRSGELTQARSRVLQAQVSRDTLAGKVREAQIALQRLVGTADVPIDALITAFEQVPPLEPLLQDLPAQPALRQLDAEREAQSSLAKSLQSARLPQVSAVVSRAPVAPGVINGYGSYAGITVNMPLFRGNSDVAAQRAAEERASGAGERRQQGEVDLTTRLRTLHETATATLGRVPEFAGLLRESDQVRRGFFEQWYQMGRRSLFELLAAESEHYALLTAHINTLYDGLATCARLRGEAGALASWLGFAASERAVRERSN